MFYMWTAVTIFSEALTQAFLSLSRLDSSCVDVQFCLQVFAEADSYRLVIVPTLLRFVPMSREEWQNLERNVANTRKQTHY